MEIIEERSTGASLQATRREGSSWLDHARAVLDRIEATQGDAIEAAGALCAEAIGSGGLVHLFGSGHSRIPVEEMFPRYGSYPGFNPIVELSMTFHTQVVGANGQRQAMFIERVPGLAATILRNFRFGPADAMIVFSASGLSAVPVEMALGARGAGASRDRGHVGRPVARRTDRPPGGRPAPRRGGHRDRSLHPGRGRDVRIDGLVTPVGPGSTLADVAIVNTLKVRVAELLVERGAMPPVLTSGSLVGAEESARLFDAAYDEHARRISRVYAGEEATGS